MSTVQRDVGRMLASYSRRTLETWAQARGLDPKRLRGPDLQAQVAHVLLAPAALKAALAMTNDEERLVLGRIKLEGGKVPALELKAQVAVDGVRDPDAVLFAKRAPPTSTPPAARAPDSLQSATATGQPVALWAL